MFELGDYALRSPALITGTSDEALPTTGAPSLGWRIAIISEYKLTVLIVSDKLSPLDVELLALSENPNTSPPKESIADSKLNLVLVLGS